MRPQFRQTLRQLRALIVIPFLLVACGPVEKTLQSDGAITKGEVVTDVNKSRYMGVMSVVLLRQFRQFSNQDGQTVMWQDLCSGTIIAKNIILTAAHCLVSPLDQADMFVEFPLTQEEVKLVKVVEALPHASYDDNFKTNDLMLLKLETEIPKDYLPMKFGSYHNGYVPRGNLSLFGFGRSKSPNFGVNAVDDVEEPTLRNVVVELSAREESFLKFDQRFSGGACKGDSGGPAVLKDGFTPVVVGVSSNLVPFLTNSQWQEVNDRNRYNGDLLRYLQDHPGIELCKGTAAYVDLGIYMRWIDDGVRKLSK